MRSDGRKKSKTRGFLRFLSQITLISTVLGVGSATGYFTAQYLDRSESLIAKFADLQIKSKLGIRVRQNLPAPINMSQMKKTNQVFMAKTDVMHASDMLLVAAQKRDHDKVQQSVTASKTAYIVKKEPVILAANAPLITNSIKPYPLPSAGNAPSDDRTIIIQPASLNLGKTRQDMGGATISLRASVSEKGEEVKSAALAPIRIAPTDLLTTEKFRASTEARRLAAEKHCLAQAIYFEARSEPSLGQMAVANVVMNRVNSKHYPNTICGVVFQGEERRNKCQFSFACDGKTDRPRKDKHWRRAERIALQVMRGKKRIRALDDTLHYHADYVRPRWSRKMRRVKKIGRHIFFFDRSLKDRG